MHRNLFKRVNQFNKLLAFCLLGSLGTAWAVVDDPRWCGEPVRNASGTIVRSSTQVRLFVRTFPCPVTLLPTTSCVGWDVDHIIPLASGGCDKPLNMQWLPNKIKSCAGAVCKDRWERAYHATPRRKVLPPA